MKTKFLKMMLPMLAFILAMATALATKNPSGMDNLLAPQGYIHTAQDPCDEVADVCTFDIGPTCTTPSGAQIYAADIPGPNPTVCNVQLYKP